MTARMPRETWLAVWDRDEGLCRRCGHAGTEVHHRRPKGLGGTSVNPHTMPRMVLLCTPCHQWVHAHPALAYPTGLLIRQSEPDSDEQIPITDLHGRTVFLTDDGSVIPILRGAS